MAIFASAFSPASLPREKTLLPDECERILSRAKETDARLYVFLAIAFNTGLRVSEVLHITWSDLIDGKLRIVRRKKKDLRSELIDVTPALWDILQEWGQMFTDGWLFPGRAKPCIIRRSENGVRLLDQQICDGGHIAKRAIQEGWDDDLISIGLKMKGRGIHSTRHASITNFYSKFLDLRAAQLFAGHSSVEMTMRYTKVLDMREKVRAMPTIL